MFGHISATPSRAERLQQDGARSESALVNGDPTGGSDLLSHVSGALFDTGNERMPTIIPGSSLSESPPRRRLSAPALSVGIVIYLVSLGLVATATVGVFFGAGFLLLWHP